MSKPYPFREVNPSSLPSPVPQGHSRVGIARCAVRAACSSAIILPFAAPLAEAVPPAVARAGTSQRDVPTPVRRLHGHARLSSWLAAFLVFSSGWGCLGAAESATAVGSSGGATNLPAKIEPKDSIAFRNGDSLNGTLQLIDAEGGIGWRHPDALELIEFLPGTVSEIQLGYRAPATFSSTNTCRIHLANQDELEGNLIFCDTNQVVLETWYAGKIEIPRNRIQFITPRPSVRPPVFDGLTGVEGWTMGKVAPAVPNAGDWQYKNGAFYATRSASIARNLKLPDMASIQFDLNWKGLLYMAIALYTDYLHPISLTAKDSEPDFGGFYSLQLYNYAANLLPVTKQDPLRYLEQASIPSMIQKNKIHLEIRVDKAKHLIALLADGVLVKQWIDKDEFVGTGTGMRFVHQGQGSVKLSNLRVTEWDGQFEEKPTNSPDSKQDLAKLQNGDKALGDLLTILDGKVTFAIPGGTTLDIPLNRVKLLEMAGLKTVRAKDDPADIQAFFRNGGSVTLRLEKWDEQEVVGINPNLGKVVFKSSAFERILIHRSTASKPTADSQDQRIPLRRTKVRADAADRIRVAVD
jgi:hypothetical protein